MLMRSCTCGHFQENSIPCGHAFSFIYALQAKTPKHPSPRSYVPYFFSNQAWKNTYEHNLKPILLSSLEYSPGNSCAAPTQERKIRGRPKLTRMTSGAQRKLAKAQARLNGQTLTIPETGQGSQACGYCGKHGHNQLTCQERQVQVRSQSPQE
ncbi:hypothetical protein BDZ91DRAFT_741818 [Kalaharituber pfeilii]|nr:hypothetical protein BDZ91DRAFT_741818 [Kalaharituber pfeilii]